MTEADELLQTCSESPEQTRDRMLQGMGVTASEIKELLDILSSWSTEDAYALIQPALTTGAPYRSHYSTLFNRVAQTNTIYKELLERYITYGRERLRKIEEGEIGA